MSELRDEITKATVKDDLPKDFKIDHVRRAWLEMSKKGPVTFDVLRKRAQELSKGG